MAPSAAAVLIELEEVHGGVQAVDSQQEQIQQQIAWALELDARMIPAALSALIRPHGSF
jgi:hypothetical protein